MKPNDKPAAWKCKTAIDRLSNCKALLYFKGFLTESENTKVQQRLVKWVAANRKESKR